jgi:hypothetical protein
MATNSTQSQAKVPRTSGTISYLLAGLLVCLLEIAASVQWVDVAAASGRATGIFIAPIMIAVIFSVSKRYRNRHSAARVFFWASILLFLLRNYSRSSAAF